MRQVIQRYTTPAIALVFVALSLITFGLHGLDSDEGVILNMAWQLWSGRELYSEVIEYIPPITPSIIWLTWLLTSTTSYLAAKLVFIALWLGVSIAMYRYLQTQHIASGWIWLALFGWLAVCSQYVLLNHNTLSSLFAIIVALLWLRALAKPSVTRYALVGLAIGVVALTLQTKGLALLLGLLIAGHFKHRNWRYTLALLVGTSMVVVQLLWWWDIQTLWRVFVELPAQNNYLDTTLYTWPGLTWLALCLGWIIYHGIIKPKPYLYPWLLIQLALFLSTLNLIDTPHIFINAWPLIVANAIFADKLTKERYTRNLQSGPIITWRAYLLPWLVYAMCVFWLYHLLIVFSAGNLWTVDITGQRQLMVTPPLKENSTIFAGPFAPGVYYELQKDNPYIYAHNLLLCNEACQQNTLAILQQEQPDYIFLAYGKMRKFGYQLGIVDGYILSNYTLCPQYATNGGNWYARESCQ